MSEKKIFKKRFRSIQSNMIMYFSVFIVILITVATMFLYQSTNVSTKQKASEYADQVVAQVALNVKSYFDYMLDIADMAGSYDVDEETLTSILDSIKNVRADIDSVYIFDREMELLYPSDYSVRIRENYQFTQEPWYMNAINNPGESIISSTNVQKFVHGNNNWVISISKYIPTFPTDNSRLLLIQMNYKVINDICSNIDLGEKGYVYIVDGNGEYIYHPQLQLINSGIKTDLDDEIVDFYERSIVKDGKLYNIQTINSGHKIVGVTYLDEFDIRATGMLDTFLLVLLFSWLIAMIGASRISTSIVSPLKKLEMIVNEVESGNLDIVIDDVGSMDEIDTFSNSLQSMIITIRELMEQIKIDQEKIRKSELKALQAQINPHFLYNTLESIIWLADDNQLEKVKEMVSALSKYFRIILSKGRETITVAEEIEHIRNYLIIQKIRYATMLDYSIELEDEIANCSMLKILVQPIVENSIYHGIKNSFGGGRVDIKAYSLENDIFIEVKDNGIGIKASALDKILQKGKTSKIMQGGVGLANVNERIKLLYGENYGLKIESKRKQGTKVTIKIPKIY